MIHVGNCLDVMRAMDANSVDSIVTDPPYGLSFMGKKWDYDVPSVEVWAECLRVLKPGGHLLAFSGTRTQHRMAVRIEDAGFEIRDMIAWVYGSGFPKSLDVSKAIDKAAGAEREVVGKRNRDLNWRGIEDPDSDRYASTRANAPAGSEQGHITERARMVPVTAPATAEARAWQGWGTALKPALEPITMARKPLVGTVAENVLEHGTGALNIDGARVPTDDKLGGGMENGTSKVSEGWDRPWRTDADAIERNKAATAEKIAKAEALGRWPANLIHDGSEEVTGLFGDPARFFYCAKASKSDRGAENNHPTVKPTDLMRYLCRLVTPPGGLVLDPFMGSGSTGRGAIAEGFRFTGIELDPDYARIAEARIRAMQPGLALAGAA